MDATLDVRSQSTSRSSGAIARIAVGAWLLVVVIGVSIALVLHADGAQIGINAPPLHGRFSPTLGWGSIVALAVGFAIVRYGPEVARRSPWRALLGASTLAAAMWAAALAVVRGVDRVVSPVRGAREYRAALAEIHDLGAFLPGFVDNIRSFPVHVQGHPPGTLLVLAALREIGVTSAWSQAALFVAAGALAVPAVLVAVREVAGEDAARRAAPFLVLAPVAIWVATTADALYSGVAAWGATSLIVATGRTDRSGDAFAGAGGLLLAAAAFGSYGVGLVGIVPLVIAWQRRRLRPIVVASVAAAAVVVAFAAAGFSWFDGLVATHGRYVAGIASRRPYVAFLFVNAAAFAVALGPAIAVALARLRDRKLWLIVGGGLGAVALAAASGMSKGEVERIWLPFTPWILVSGVALWHLASEAAHPRTRRDPIRGWLCIQAATAIAVESVVRTAW